MQLAAEVGSLAHEDAPGLAARVGALSADLAFVLHGGPGTERTSTLLVNRSDEFAQGPIDDDGPPAAFVRFGERHGAARVLVARPIEVDALLSTWLEPLCTIFVSATLSVAGDFRHVRQRLGVRGGDDVLVDSPFDYERQAALYIAEDLVEPDDPSFSAAASARAVDLVSASGGGAFVLCTSHRMLAVMQEALAGLELPLFVQGEAPKAKLLEGFKAEQNAVLAATMSFWQGVDVPGPALRLVIIDRLPFASPGDPIVAARLERLRARGEDPFSSYQLPQAALLLRQGFGRLIRRRTDRGLVALLDWRASSRRYGARLLAALPACPRLTDFAAAAELLSRQR